MVKLDVGSILDGNKNGNNEKPAVKIAPTIMRLVPVKLVAALCFAALIMTSKAPRIAAIGAAIVIG